MLALAQKKNWLSGEHFSVDGTLIQAWAGHKSFVRKDGSDGDDDSGDFRGTGAATTPISPAPILMRSCIAKARLAVSCATWVIP